MRAVKCAIELKLPEALESHGDQPVSLSELSSSIGCPEISLRRIMRFLTHQGIFKKLHITTTRPGSVFYAQTPLSRLLARARDDESAMWGMEIDENYSKLFQEFLACHAKVATSAVIESWPEIFQGIGTLVDVGGHEGTALLNLVKAFPWIRGINLDRPEVVSEAPALDGVEHVGGDMFESIPKADAVMLMWILHDWSDELCIEILKKCKEAIAAKNGKVIIVEAVIDEEGEERDEYTGARLALDMTIMASTVSGKERTAKEWELLVNAAGFRRHTIKHMKAIESVIVAYP
ncbi:(rs)-norcoclaurine 6-o-methyltransferase [Phtheirospermum japonicum]|uniref:(Rs)-norcoclaurine 6-o-methyltransferase n=1 Tax=Phtheirospermum japonicum TaxID=374723 RepID=A0A830BD12_9LAMI|nr:(rs)-norcoclaurine 6-o-methyltransferase [Phtheirospermum japonicum]